MRSRELAQASDALGWVLYRQLREQPRNHFFSPYSLLGALAVLLAGAPGATRQGLLAGLHLTSALGVWGAETQWPATSRCCSNFPILLVNEHDYSPRTIEKFAPQALCLGSSVPTAHTPRRHGNHDRDQGSAIHF